MGTTQHGSAHGAAHGDAAGEHPQLRTGATVAVRTGFDGSWADGFEVVDSGPGGHGAYQVRRCCDDVVLPARFGAHDVRGATPSPAAAWTDAIPG